MRGRTALAGLLILASCGDREPKVTQLGGADEVLRLDGAGPLPDGSPATFADKVEMKDGRGLYTANRGGRLTSIPFDLPLDRVAPERGHLMTPLGETDEGVVVITDVYATKDALNGRCGKGVETFVRVMSLPLQRELQAIPTTSCLDRVEVSGLEATWLPPNQFRIETPPKRVYAITGADGVDLLKGE